MSSSEQYLKINSIGVILRLYEIDVQRRIHPRLYDVLVGSEWVKLEASETHLSTSGPPIRAAELEGSGSSAEKILLLEAYLADGDRFFQMKDSDGDIFEVRFKKVIKSPHFKRVSTSIYVSGDFLVDVDRDEFQCRINLSMDNEIIGTAKEGKWSRCRALNLRELSLRSKIALIKSVADGTFPLLEKIPWV